MLYPVMQRSVFAAITVITATAAASGLLSAQSAPRAVPAAREPHHHPVYADANVRVLDVEVPAHDTTLLHQHDADYLWVALGDADLINAVYGRPEVRVHARDATLHFSRGPFAHIARNLADAPFRNVTVELLRRQTNPRNVCDTVVAGEPLSCGLGQRGGAMSGATARTAFETDQTRAKVLRLAPRGTLHVAASATPPVLIAITSADGRATVTCMGAKLGSGGATMRAGDVRTAAPGAAWTVTNAGPGTARFLALESR